MISTEITIQPPKTTQSVDFTKLFVSSVVTKLTSTDQIIVSDSLSKEPTHNDAIRLVRPFTPIPAPHFSHPATNRVQDSQIRIISERLTYMLSTILPDLIIGNHYSESIRLTSDGENMVSNISHFYRFIIQYSEVTTTEVLQSFVLLTRLLLEENKHIRTGGKGIVSDANLGTILLCSLMISIKILRDIPYKNSWWAKVLGISLQILNQSEYVFLDRIGYRCLLQHEEFGLIYSTLFATIAPISQSIAPFPSI